MSTNKFILELVTKKDIYEELRLGHMTLANYEDRQVVKRTLLMQTNEEIKLDLLKAHLEAEKEHGDMKETPLYQALQLKYEALTTTPSTIEKTMTPAQLYVSDSSLWALNYNADQIKQMINHLQNYPKSEEIFNIVLKEVSNGITNSTNSTKQSRKD